MIQWILRFYCVINSKTSFKGIYALKALTQGLLLSQKMDHSLVFCWGERGLLDIEGTSKTS